MSRSMISAIYRIDDASSHYACSRYVLDLGRKPVKERHTILKSTTLDSSKHSGLCGTIFTDTT